VGKSKPQKPAASSANAPAPQSVKLKTAVQPKADQSKASKPVVATHKPREPRVRKQKPVKAPADATRVKDIDPKGQGPTTQVTGSRPDSKPPFVPNYEATRTRSKSGAEKRKRRKGIKPMILPIDEIKLRMWDKEYMSQQQEADPDIKPARDWLKAGARPDWKDLTSASIFTKSLWHQYESLAYDKEEDVIYRLFEHSDGVKQYWQLILPTNMRPPF
jgi:hypothetical protein